MSNIEVGSRVRFTGFKNHQEEDATELGACYPDFVVGALGTVETDWGGDEFEVIWDQPEVSFNDVVYGDEVEVID